MNDVVIRILDTSNNVLGNLDLTSFTDFPLVLTKGIVNLDNLKARTGTFSKTFKVPNTKNNATLLSNIDDINSRKDYRDALNRKPCVIIANGTQIDKGFVQVSKVLEGFELDSYELVFFGNNIDWVKGASELKLNSLTYRNNAQVYNFNGIDAANFSSVSSYDHAYPYISRGGNEDINNAQVRDFYPCFYIKGLIETGLNSLGWNINSTFLNTADIKTLIADINGDMTVNKDIIDESKTRVSLTSPVSTIGFNRLVFTDDSTPPNNDVNDNYSLVTGYYTIPTTGRYNFKVTLNTGDWTLSSGASSVDLKVTIAQQFGSTVGVKGELTRSIKANQDDQATYDISALCTAGETISVWTRWTRPLNQSFNFKTGSFFEVQRSNELVEGDNFSLNEIIPSNTKLLDVINDFTRMFNIYYWTDVKTKTIYFEPRDTFFESKVTALDWSDKLDISNKYEIDYISSYKRNISFSYKDLSNDEWLKGWENANRRTYAKYTHELPERFAEGTTEIKLGLFSASYGHIASEVTPLINSSYNANIAPTTLKIWNEYATGGDVPNERISSYNPRIFFFKNEQQLSLDGSNRYIKKNGIFTKFIPYGIFESYNNTNPPQNLSFTGSDGLFETYYSSMLKNIEEGGRLIAYLNLTNTDIDNLDFRKLVYIDRPSKVSGYYLIEQVIDFNPLSDGLTKVSLFKFENLGSVPIDTTQQGNNSSNDDDANDTPPLDYIYVEDGSNLLIVLTEDSVTGAYSAIRK